MMKLALLKSPSQHTQKQKQDNLDFFAKIFDLVKLPPKHNRTHLAQRINTLLQMSTSLGLPQEEQDVEQTVQSLEAAIATIERQVSALFDVPADTMQSKLAQFEQAKLNIATVYAINTLFYSM